MKRYIVGVTTAAFMVSLSPALFASETYKPPPESVKQARITVESVYQKKCSKCHAISQPDQAVKTADGWKITVLRMRDKDPGWMSATEAESIYRWLGGRGILNVKCSKCHGTERADILKTIPQWQTTVDRMQSKDSTWISNDDKKAILFYLTDVDLLELD